MEGGAHVRLGDIEASMGHVFVVAASRAWRAGRAWESVSTARFCCECWRLSRRIRGTPAPCSIGIAEIRPYQDVSNSRRHFQQRYFPRTGVESDRWKMRQ